MKNFYTLLIVTITLFATPLFAQDSVNCFLEDFEPKDAVTPPYEDVEKPSAPPTVTITTDVSDTLGKVSKYIFGNALAVWIGSVNVTNNPLISHLKKMSPTLIRYPGGSWSDIFFWNGNPGDLPDSLFDGTNGQKYQFTPQYGTGSWPTTVSNYYSLRDSVNTQGLITINYAYARYGLSPEPVKQAAHLAADWVRYDNGRTKFWEIGNENAGPWEAGWQIDPNTNQDGQPDTITGALYGQHFKIFADSMRAAAAEIGTTIYIGGQIIHYDGTTSWNIADRQWNVGFFNEAGDSPDFYVIHNYYGSAGSVANLLNSAISETNLNINFIRQDIINKQAAVRPIALTEWNIRWDLVTDNLHRTSFINGMQAVILSCELIKLNCGMSARWLIANWESDGMFYRGNDGSIPTWNPRPDVFYMYYLQKFFGDHSVATTSDNSNVLAYSSTFNSGETGVVVVNKGTDKQIVRVRMPDHTVGDRIYVYSLTGGTDNGDFSQIVNVNDESPLDPYWGPIDDLLNIPAKSHLIDGDIKFISPSRSVQFILIENGDNPLPVEKESRIIKHFKLNQNYPNPFNPKTIITYSLPQESIVTLKVYDIIGSEVASLIDNDRKTSGKHEISFDAANLPSGVYFYKLQAGNPESSSGQVFTETKKMLVIK